MDVLIIVPTYNEIDNLEPLIQAIFQHVPQSHILVVDDNSPDGTGKRADLLAQQESRIQVLHRSQKEGLGQAYLAGFRYALQKNYRIIVQMDADFSHPPELLPKLIAPCREGSADLCLGSRYVKGGHIEGWSFFRRTISSFGSIYARFWLRVSVRDLTGGFKCWKREVLESIEFENLQSSGYCFQIELTYRAHLHHFKIVEIPIHFPERIYGKSKMSMKIALEAAYRVPLMPHTIKFSTEISNKI
ncbi:MAG: polyprenol monophosphomannose synthase [Planctomycetota bacterium]